MQKNKYADYGVVKSGDDAFSFGIERYQDLLRDAEESRKLMGAVAKPAKKKQASLFEIWQVIAQLF
jgi:hypothetical protein